MRRRSVSSIWCGGCKAAASRLLDTQFATKHLERFGCVEIPRARYLELLEDAIGRAASWPR